MTRHVHTKIRFDGPAMAGHDMDVQDLAPALLALADVIQIANRKFNGTQASIRVLVNADVEQRCFMIDLSLVQSFLDQAKGFLGSDLAPFVHERWHWRWGPIPRRRGRRSRTIAGRTIHGLGWFRHALGRTKDQRYWEREANVAGVQK